MPIQPLKIVQVKLPENGRSLYFQAQEFNLSIGEEVIVEGEQGETFGEVISRQKLTPRENKKELLLKKVKRLAAPPDKKRLEENKVKEEEAFQACLKKIEEGEIPMKLVDVAYSFNRSRITFSFTAAERIDFRKLVKDLAQLFKARIEMRRMGARDEARRLGGYGCCGQPLCCATFLQEFEPVTIGMAKEQRLSLDPDRVSGTCGRLLCCLMFECRTYRELGKRMPREGTRVITKQGEGEVVDLNILKRLVTVEFEEGQRIEFPLEKIARTRTLRRRKESARVPCRKSKSGPG